MCSGDVGFSGSHLGGLGSVSGLGSEGASAHTGIILAGGSSSRLGQNKALVRIAGCSLIERVVDVLRPLVADLLLVAQAAEPFADLHLPTVSDIYPGMGTLGGLYTGLCTMRTEYGLVVGCDMPFLNAGLLRFMISRTCGYDVVMPRIGKYHEPLHALYSRRCVPALERSILAGPRRILEALSGAHIRYIKESEIDRFDPDHLSFFNVNTPDELERARSLLAL